jgi:thiamine-monophosphate kinase
MPLMDAERIEEIHENRLLERWAALLPRDPRQLGRVHESDAELWPLGDGRLLAITVDTVCEEVDLGLYRSPFTTGRTAAVAALSDLAAVGADPVGLLLAVGLPPHDTAAVQEGVARGTAEACAEAGTFVLGGDTNTSVRLCVGSTGVGLVPEADVLRRVGMRAGDLVYASGPLGLGAALAAARWAGLPEGLFAEEEYRPRVCLRFGRALRRIASACMDTSDGLVATLDQLSRLNGVALRIERPLEELLSPRADAVRREAGLPALAFLAGQHGEFELVFAVPPARRDALESAAVQLAWRPLLLGRAEAGSGLWVGERPVDGTRVRNLLEDAGGDPRAYIRALCRWDVAVH